MARGARLGPRSGIEPAGRKGRFSARPKTRVEIWHRPDAPGIGRGLCRSPMRRGGRGRRRY